MKTDKIKEGVTEAFDFWLSQHPITMQDLVELSLTQAMKEWLDKNREEIIEKIASAAVK